MLKTFVSLAVQPLLPSLYSLQLFAVDQALIIDQSLSNFIKSNIDPLNIVNRRQFLDTKTADPYTSD